MPTGATDIQIPNVAGATIITVPTGTQAARSVVIVGDETLAITGGSLTVGSASTATLGTLSIAGGTLSGTGSWAVRNLNVSSCTINTSANINVSNAFTWSGGTVGGTGDLTTAGVSTLSAATIRTLQGRNWNNQGTVDLTNGRLVVNGGTFINEATRVVNVTSGDADPIAGTAGTFTNAGTLNWNTSGPAFLGSSMTAFNNTGMVNVDGGTLRTLTGGTDTGVYNVAAGGTLAFHQGVTRNLNAGSNITGAGALVVDGAVNVRGNLGIAGTGTVSIGDVLASLDIDTVGTGVTFANTLTTLRGGLSGADNLTLNGAFNSAGGM